MGRRPVRLGMLANIRLTPSNGQVTNRILWCCYIADTVLTTNLGYALSHKSARPNSYCSRARPFECQFIGSANRDFRAKPSDRCHADRAQAFSRCRIGDIKVNSSSWRPHDTSISLPELRGDAASFADHLRNRQPSRTAHLQLPAVWSLGDRSCGLPSQ